MLHKMQLWISEMDYTLFDGVLEFLKAKCLPPSIKFDQADGQLVLETHLLI